MHIKNIFVLILLAFIGLSSCGKPAGYTHPEVKKDQDARALYERTHQTRPPVDPALCQNNPEGYLYFKVGEELFRVNKDSPLIIAGVYVEVDEHGQAIPDVSGIAKGCKDNPLKGGANANFYFNTNYKVGRDDLIIDAEQEDFRYGIDDVPQQDYARLTSTLYSMKNFLWEDRHKIYKDQDYGENGNLLCENVIHNLVHCKEKSLVDQGLKDKFGTYVANPSVVKSAQNLPLVFQCNPAIPEIRCETYYRLYPTVNLKYSIRYKNSAAFNPQNFIPLDAYMRKMYESMRIKN